MATKKINAGVDATVVAVITPEKTKKSGQKKSTAANAATKTTTAAKPKAKKPAAKKSSSKKSVAKKKTAATKSASPVMHAAAAATLQPLVNSARHSYTSARWTLIDVGEVYLATIFFSLVMLGIIYWVITLAGIFQTHASVAMSTSHFVMEQAHIASILF